MTLNSQANVEAKQFIKNTEEALQRNQVDGIEF